MGAKDKKRFEDLSGKDKIRYDKAMESYVPAAGETKGKRKKKDPNAPKRPLSSFFYFCNEERPKVRAIHPEWGVGDIAKDMGKKWEACTNRTRFEEMNAKAKIRYEKEMTAYKKKSGATGGASSPKKAKKKPEPVEEEEDEEEEDDEEEDDE